MKDVEGIPAVPGQIAEKLQAADAKLDDLGKAVETQSAAESSPPPTAQPATSSPAATSSKVIRNGQIEFEVDSFDSALSTISKIVAEENGFVATTNSAKLDNGKVKGTVVVARSAGASGSARAQAAQDLAISSGRTSRRRMSAGSIRIWRASCSARAMEDRLLDIIKNGKGAIKDLLAAEKELAVWHRKLEQIEGQINYYNNLISLSTLSIELAERNIATAAAATEQENVNAGVETRRR